MITILYICNLRYIYFSFNIMFLIVKFIKYCSLNNKNIFRKYSFFIDEKQKTLRE